MLFEPDQNDLDPSKSIWMVQNHFGPIEGPGIKDYASHYVFHLCKTVKKMITSLIGEIRWLYGIRLEFRPEFRSTFKILVALIFLIFWWCRIPSCSGLVKSLFQSWFWIHHSGCSQWKNLHLECSWQFKTGNGITGTQCSGAGSGLATRWK